jgi:hypothetical protein
MASKPQIQRDLNLLLPSFRVAVERVLGALRDRGFDPWVFETLRSKERARALKADGKSKNGERSLHVFDDGFSGACDIICRQRKWSHPEFFAALGEEAKRAKLVWGGDWRMRDLPHIQACAVHDQDVFRAMSALDRDAFVQRRIG